MEVRALHRQQTVERRLPLGVGVGEDHLAHHRDAGGVEEHVLGAAEPEAVDLEVARHPRLGRRVGVRAHAEVAHGVGPVEELGEGAAELGLDHRRRAGDHLAAGAVEGDAGALAEDAAVRARQRPRREVEAELARTHDAGDADAAGDHGGVAGHAAAHGQDAARGVHAADVLGAGLEPDEDHRLVLRRRGLGRLGGEDDMPGSGAWAGGEAGAEDVARGRRVDLRVQVLDQAARLDAQHRLGAGDGAGVGEVDGDAHRRAAVAARRHGVDDGDAAVLDGEFEAEGVAEAGGGARRGGAKLGQRLGMELLERSGAAAVSGRASRAPRRVPLPCPCGRNSPMQTGAPVLPSTNWTWPEPLTPGPMPSTICWTTRPRPASAGAPRAWRRMRAEGALQARAIARAAASSCTAGSSGQGTSASAAK